MPVEQATIVLVTDHSRSMTRDRRLARTASRPRASAADRFLDQVPKGVRVGAVAFNQRARAAAGARRPTAARCATRSARSRPRAARRPARASSSGWRPRKQPGAARPEAAARRDRPARPTARPPTAATSSRSPGRPRRPASPCTPSRSARQSGALPGGGTATTDHESLRQIAELSGGKFRTAADADQLRAVYEELGSRAQHQATSSRQVTSTAAGGGLLLLLAGAGFSLFSFGRLP